MNTDNPWSSFFEDRLSGRRQQNRFRSLKAVEPQDSAATIQRDGKTLINFSANDYLGLSRHPKLIERAREYAEKYGTGATASRLISGTYTIHQQLEEKLADTFDSEAALIFNSGFQANSSILGSITDRHSLIIADKLSHNSLLQGSLLSRADFQRYEHNDPDHLESLLKQAESDRILIVTETVFSMDGDRTDLERLTNLADQHNAMLFIDDAHAVGVWGPNGLGLAHGHDRIDITLGTFGKAFGVFGAFVLCSRRMRDYLVNFCPGFIYTTALPPPVIGALDAALELIPELGEERASYHRKIDRLKEGIQEAGFDTGRSASQIIPIIIGGEEETLKLADFLEEHGILGTAIRPPTVPEESSRIRITLSSKHTEEQIEHFLTTLSKWDGR